jgi:predicted short-subunit dehydrogenase-like oxidoreductase (DUF2520 family)
VKYRCAGGEIAARGSGPDTVGERPILHVAGRYHSGGTDPHLIPPKSHPDRYLVVRELERQPPQHPLEAPATGIASVGVVGRGRLGNAMVTALRAAGYRVGEQAGRGEVPAGEAILLCVPDAEIGAAAAAVSGAAAFVGHTSGATPLEALEPSGAQAFGLHPLQTVPERGADLRGCGCAVAGATPEALDLAQTLATRLGMRPFEVRDAQRAAYHAAASMASNYLVTLEWAAESLAASAGIEGADARGALGPLVRSTVENWIALGPQAALTGPIARGDESTVARQRAAVGAAAPELLATFDALAERTRALAAQEVPA